jgi:cellulose synthase/poly-beta-1,6-N-acetylglucosamine synthase-like glycosyltransferase
MAFRRSTLLGIGGFDVQFRQAGDDVDVCWRLLDAGYTIGYAPAALVWHHRRTSVRAYYKQQAGYGRSEAMLQFKHPQRFNRLGYSQWLGVIYGEGAVGLPVAKAPVYHGKFGAGLFQIIYRSKSYTPWAYFTLFEWHVLALVVASFAFVWARSSSLPACGACRLDRPPSVPATLPANARRGVGRRLVMHLTHSDSPRGNVTSSAARIRLPEIDADE